VSVWKDIAQRGVKVNITTLAVVSFLFLVPTAVILYIASHRVTIEEAEIEDNKNKNKIVITPQQVFSRDPWSVACARLDKRDDDEKNTKNKTNKSISKSTFDDDEWVDDDFDRCGYSNYSGYGDYHDYCRNDNDD